MCLPATSRRETRAQAGRRPPSPAPPAARVSLRRGTQPAAGVLVAAQRPQPARAAAPHTADGNRRRTLITRCERSHAARRTTQATIATDIKNETTTSTAAKLRVTFTKPTFETTSTLNPIKNTSNPFLTQLRLTTQISEGPVRGSRAAAVAPLDAGWGAESSVPCSRLTWLATSLAKSEPILQPSSFPDPRLAPSVPNRPPT
jgi:hypothetical protein